MNGEFKDKVVLITGASNGIGAETARRFASFGARVVLNFYSDVEAAEKIKKECAKDGQTIILIQGNVADEAFVKEMFKKVSNEVGKVEFLINNAGINRDGFLMTSKVADIDKVIDTNLQGTIYCCKHAFSHMISNRGGVIVNVASVSGIKGSIGQSIYGATKAGIIGLTKALAVEMARNNIRVNSISPGFIDTRMVHKIPQRLKDEYLNAIPMKRFGECSEVVDLIEFLLSSKSKYIDGQNIVIDGGLTS